MYAIRSYYALRRSVRIQEERPPVRIDDEPRVALAERRQCLVEAAQTDEAPGANEVGNDFQAEMGQVVRGHGTGSAKQCGSVEFGRGGIV